MSAAIKTRSRSALNGMRVIELPSEYTEYCGKLYADMGADVILLEPLGGSALRHRAPFFQDRKSPSGSITFNYYNAGKRSIIIDLDSKAGRSEFFALLTTANVLLDGLSPSKLPSVGFGFDAISKINPALVVANVTPFGSTGPFAGFEADDLTLNALGGLLVLGGYADAEPTVAYGNQAYHAAAQFAAVSTMAALLSAQKTGRGQHIDVSAHEAIVLGLENAAQFYQLEGKLRHRIGGTQTVAGNGQFPCKDGEFYLLAGGLASMRFWTLTVDWLIEEGAPGAKLLLEPQWKERTFLATHEAKAAFSEIFTEFAKTKTKAELFDECLRRRIPAAPVATPADVLQSVQMRHRGFFTMIPARVLKQDFVAPGAPYQLSETPVSLQGPAPHLGEHTEEVLEQIRSSGESHSASRAEATVRSLNVTKPLKGVRVIDFSWVGAGSYTTKILADLGADVIKIESTRKVDDLRMAPPFKDGKPGLNRSGYFADRNTSKRSMLLNLKNPEGLKIAKRLITECDLIANNFAPGVMDKLGLSYAELSRLNPKLVYLSMTAQGQDGPQADMIGYGLTLAALSGIHHLSGRPDREPVGTGTHFPDHIPNPCHAAFAVLAALRYQRVSGIGQSVDLAQTEPMAALIGPAFIQQSVSEHGPKRIGNRSEHYAPRGVFPCRGSDRWIAISVRSDTEWEQLIGILGGERDRPHWSKTADRLVHQQNIQPSGMQCS